MAELDLQLPLVPLEVRVHDLDQFALLGRILVKPLRVGILREFEHYDPFAHVIGVYGLVPLDFRQNLGLIPSPFGRLLRKELGVNLPVQLVEVHPLDPLLQAVVLALERIDGAGVDLTLFVVAGKQGILNQCHDFFIESKTEQMVAEYLEELLLPDPSILASRPNL